jgi:crotonobetainyl-CoA:carnitine CoA-transferase CaiB-like acyl-CoA transferase
MRVIDLSWILAGPYCTMLLADYGAEVLKIEQPESGDGIRQWGPPWLGGESAYFLSANRNKKSVTLNLQTAEGLAILKKLLLDADVLIENFKPGTLSRLGLDPKTLAADYPALINCSITGPADGEPSKVGVAKLSHSPANIHSAPPILGADTDAVLSELGFTSEQRAGLREQGVI